MDRLSLPVSLTCARDRLNSVYGCLANAIRYLHDNNVRHKDIKPRNILLDRNDGLYSTVFGLSRDTTDLSSSVTNGNDRGTYKYCAPEVARYEPRGRAADIYSLGCVFLEVNTIHRRLSLAAFEDFRIYNEDRSYQNNPPKLLEWISKLREIKTDNPETGVFDCRHPRENGFPSPKRSSIYRDRMFQPVHARRPRIFWKMLCITTVSNVSKPKHRAESVLSFSARKSR
jgi:serine/threonine protein kinase